MTYREKLYRRLPNERPSVSTPSLDAIADWVEYAAFAALGGAILSLAAKGIFVALGLTPLLVFGAFLSASVGLLITFASLLLLAIVIDGIHGYVEFLSSINEEESAEEQTEHRI